MGIMPTDKWLEKDFRSPLKICEKFRAEFQDDSAKKIYGYLHSFGMYRPSSQTYKILEHLIAKKTWDTVDKLFQKYKQRWYGPDIPIYIFPMNINTRNKETKSGLSFQKQLFLFIGELEDEKEIEALFVHEYHHACRLHHQKKKIENYTLLDSIVMEGLAEFAVRLYCGEAYNAKWCHLYEEEKLEKLWTEEISKNLSLKKSSSLHDELLFGLNKYPDMLGYSFGYYLVNKYHNQHQLRGKDTLLFKSETFLDVD